jgi:glycosyltransferase involved in cell wall biosynthesis
MQLFEANAFGLPVITNHLHGPGAIVDDETGIRCACDTPEIAIAGLKNAILHVYNNPAAVKAMSVAAHAFALKQNWPGKIDSIVNQYYPLQKN